MYPSLQDVRKRNYIYIYMYICTPPMDPGSFAARMCVYIYISIHLVATSTRPSLAKSNHRAQGQGLPLLARWAEKAKRTQTIPIFPRWRHFSQSPKRFTQKKKSGLAPASLFSSRLGRTEGSAGPHRTGWEGPNGRIRLETLPSVSKAKTGWFKGEPLDSEPLILPVVARTCKATLPTWPSRPTGPLLMRDATRAPTALAVPRNLDSPRSSSREARIRVPFLL